MNNKTNVKILGRDEHDLSLLTQLESEGYKLLCPVCHAEVWVIDTPEKMYQYHSSRGARCSVDANHYGFYLVEKRMEDFWTDIPMKKRGNTSDT